MIEQLGGGSAHEGQAASFLLDDCCVPSVPAPNPPETRSQHRDELAQRLLKRLRQTRETARTNERTVAVIAHELRSPLTSLRLLVEDLMEPENDRSELTRIHQIVLGMAETLDRLVDAASIKHGCWEVVDLHRCCREALAILEPQIPAQTRVKFNIHHSACQLTGNADALRRLVVNLLGNASRHTPAGDISIDLRFTGKQWLCLTISDTGSGIEEETLSKLGAPFSAGPDRQTGSGLGLWIARTIAAAHGGHLCIWSERGIGTTVTAQLRPSLARPCPVANPPPIRIIPARVAT